MSTNAQLIALDPSDALASICTDVKNRLEEKYDIMIQPEWLADVVHLAIRDYQDGLIRELEDRERIRRSAILN